MNGQTTYRYISNSNDWTRELIAAFGGGFLLATLLWLGLWYFQTRPAPCKKGKAQCRSWSSVWSGAPLKGSGPTKPASGSRVKLRSSTGR